MHYFLLSFVALLQRVRASKGESLSWWCRQKIWYYCFCFYCYQFSLFFLKERSSYWYGCRLSSSPVSPFVCNGCIV